MPYPRSIAEAPQVGELEVFYYLAYMDLATCRLYEGGPIPYNAIIYYGERLELDPEEAEFLSQIIKHLDSQFRAWWKAQQKDK